MLTTVSTQLRWGLRNGMWSGALGQAHPVMFDWLDTTLTR